MPDTAIATPHRIHAPIESALGLPNQLYTSPEILAAEREKLFGRTWICIGLTGDVPNVGDVHPVIAAGQPLLIVRNQATVDVFYNVCRHRGTTLVDKPQRGLRTITCPYHAWAYRLTGELQGTPHFGGQGNHDHPNLDASQHGLRKVRSGIWNHLVFVNLSGDAPPLEEWFAPINEHWKDYDFALVRHGGSMRFEIPANWKLVLENYLESYHLPMVHPNLSRYSPLKDHELVLGGDLYMGQLSLNYRPKDTAAGRLATFPNLPADRRFTGEYLLLFPNLMISCTPDHLRVTILEAPTPDRTLQRWEFFFLDDAAWDQHGVLRQAVVDRIREVNTEDLDVLERLQAGRSCKGFDGGCFSPHHERTVHNFQRLVAKDLAGEF